MADQKGYLVVSDLHLSEGRDPVTGWINPKEDFLFDDDFADFLEHHTSAPEWEGTEWTLIIAGDFVDFLQVTAVPDSRPELEREENYGLVAGPKESAWKMSRIMTGHSTLFAALARFSIEHRIVIVSGNHDAEFIYPEVRKTVSSFLRERISELTGSAKPCPPPIFLPWFYFHGGIYVEHGHQYDPANAFPEAQRPFLPNDGKGNGNTSKKRIFLTLGSIFVRYLFNRVETSSPFADNIKPETRFIGWFILNHPLRAMAYLFTDGGTMLRRIRENRSLLKKFSAVQDSDIEARKQREVNKAQEFPGTSIPHETLGKLEGIQAEPLVSRARKPLSGILQLILGPGRIAILLSLLLLLNLAALLVFLSPVWTLMLPESLAANPLLLSIVNWDRSTQVPLGFLLLQAFAAGTAWLALRRSRAKHCCSRIIRNKASEIDRLLHPEYIIMGHCHETDLVKFPSGCQYTNTGTWTKIFSRESSATREEKEFVYTRILDSNGNRSMDLMKWEGRGGTGRRANLIDG